MCPVCKKEDANLKRHLMSHARKGHIKAESVASILSIAINKGKRRGPARSTSTGKQEQKGLKLKWCPVKDCQKVTHLSTKKSPFQIPQYQSSLFNGEVSLYGKGVQRKG